MAIYHDNTDNSTAADHKMIIKTQGRFMRRPGDDLVALLSLGNGAMCPISCIVPIPVCRNATCSLKKRRVCN